MSYEVSFTLSAVFSTRRAACCAAHLTSTYSITTLLYAFLGLGPAIVPYVFGYCQSAYCCRSLLWSAPLVHRHQHHYYRHRLHLVWNIYVRTSG